MTRARYFRSSRGGIVPLDDQQREELLELYGDLNRPVREIAELFHVSTHSIYRWLALLGVRAWPNGTDPYRKDRDEATKKKVNA